MEAPTALHRAVLDDDVSAVTSLLRQRHVNYNAVDEEGRTALYLAAKEEHGECLMAILRHASGRGPLRDIPTKHQDSALHACLRRGDDLVEAVRQLVHLGSDVSLHNDANLSPIHAALNAKCCRETLEILILQGRGMDLDRQAPVPIQPLKTVFNHFEVPEPSGSPLLQVVFPLNDGKDSSAQEENCLAALMVRMGASRRSLEALLWWELHRLAPAGPLLEVLMNTFLRLPSLEKLGKRLCLFAVSVQDKGGLSTRYYIADSSSNPGLRESLGREAVVPGRGKQSDLVTAKKKMYRERRRQLPTLQQMCRAKIRSDMGSTLPKVLSWPRVPDPIKRYILLGHQWSN